MPSGWGLVFDLVGDGGYPGIPAYAGASDLTPASVSVTGWLANSGYNANKIYNSTYFLNAIPADVSVANGTLTMVGSSIGQSELGSGGTSAYDSYWYEYDPAANFGQGLEIAGPVDLGSRKVVLIVKGADVTLKGNINLTKGSGFFLLVANNIIVDPTVGGGGYNLEGIYVSDGQFQTGLAATQLWVRGTVAAYGGVSLDRDLGDNSTTPAEIFEYAPDLELLFPGVIAAHPMSWQEVAP